MYRPRFSLYCLYMIQLDLLHPFFRCNCCCTEECIQRKITPASFFLGGGGIKFALTRLFLQIVQYRWNSLLRDCAFLCITRLHVHVNISYKGKVCAYHSVLGSQWFFFINFHLLHPLMEADVSIMNNLNPHALGLIEIENT